MVAIALMEMAVSIVCKDRGPWTGACEGHAQRGAAPAPRSWLRGAPGHGTRGAAPTALPLPLNPQAELLPVAQKRPNSTPPHTLPGAHPVGPEGDPARVPTPWGTAELSSGPGPCSHHLLRTRQHRGLRSNFLTTEGPGGTAPKAEWPASGSRADEARPTGFIQCVRVRVRVHVRACVCTHQTLSGDGNRQMKAWRRARGGDELCRDLEGKGRS